MQHWLAALATLCRRFLARGGQIGQGFGRIGSASIGLLAAVALVLAFVGLIASHSAPRGTSANVGDEGGTPVATADSTQTASPSPSADASPTVSGTPTIPPPSATNGPGTQPGQVTLAGVGGGPTTWVQVCDSVTPVPFWPDIVIVPTTKPTTVTYRWVRSDGWSQVDTLTIPAGKMGIEPWTHQMVWNWTGAMGDGTQRWVYLQVLSPGTFTSRPFYTTITCLRNVRATNLAVTSDSSGLPANTYDCSLKSETFTASLDIVPAPSPGGYKLWYYWTTPDGSQTDTVTLTVAPDQAPIHAEVQFSLTSASPRGSYDAQLHAFYVASDGTTDDVYANPIGVTKLDCASPTPSPTSTPSPTQTPSPTSTPTPSPTATTSASTSTTTA